MSETSKKSTMRIAKLPLLLLIVLCLMLFISYVRWKPKAQANIVNSLPDLLNNYEKDNIPKKILYGIMFDAGSTGTRIHVYKFNQISSGAPFLEHETFKAIKPGLSAYADEPEKCTTGLKELLNIAAGEIPEHFQGSTPLVLKATAGLRLLPGEKAQKLLNTVTELFKTTPFLVGKDSVSILNGSDEGIFAWITVNYLSGSLRDPSERLSGMLDLGGGSTQITFYPYDKNTFPNSPAGYITNFDLFNNTYHLYSHSYLGLGLMSARLQIMGGIEGQPLETGGQLVTFCITPDFETDFQQAGITYKVKGKTYETSLYESCYRRVTTMLTEKVSCAQEVDTLFFYALSYYFDRAEDAKLIDPTSGGFVKASDFEMAARKACTEIEKTAGSNPFLCMDLTYITRLLQELGFTKDKQMKLVNKINDAETSWALGATFYYMNLMKSNA